MILPDARLQLLLDLVGVLVFAVSGGLVAVKKQLDLFGVLVLALVAGLGGGVLRDLLIGIVPPTGVTDWRLVAAGALGGLLTFLWHPAFGRISRIVKVLDAAGLGAFCVSGALTALALGMPDLTCVIVGTLSAIGGGMLRDVLAREVPEVLTRELYAVPALLGATLVVVAHELHVLVWWVALAASRPGLRAADDGRGARPERPAAAAHTTAGHNRAVSDADANDSLSPYDALLLVSFGGPEGPDDVMPFLENVTRGPGHPARAAAGVAEHYGHFGGVSPINAQNRALIAALEGELARRGIDLPVRWGNRNWAPYLADTLARRSAGQRVLALVTSAYSSYSGCRQYREDLAAAVGELGDKAPAVDKVRHYFDHPGFVGPTVRNVAAALDSVPPARSCVSSRTRSRPPWRRSRAAPARTCTSDSTARSPSSSWRASTRPGAADAVGARLLLAVRTADPAVARAGHQRRAAGAGGGGRPRCGGRADRLRQRPHGGHVRPRHRGSRDGRRDRAALRAGRDRRHRPRVRRGPRRPGGRARRRVGRDARRAPGAQRARSVARPVPARVLRQPARPEARLLRRCGSGTGPRRWGGRRAGWRGDDTGRTAPRRPAGPRPAGRRGRPCSSWASGRPTCGSLSKSSPTDPVTEMDSGSERLIARTVPGGARTTGSSARREATLPAAPGRVGGGPHRRDRQLPLRPAALGGQHRRGARGPASCIHLTRRMAAKLIGDHIVVTAIAPGPFKSDMNRAARDHADEVATRVPAGRVGTDEDMASTAIYVGLSRRRL